HLAARGVLGGRLNPTEFVWAGPANGQWENPANWTVNGVAQGVLYPGWDGTRATTNDKATSNASDTNSCRMTEAHTLLSLSIVGANNVLSLRAALTLSNFGGSCGQMSGGVLYQGDAATGYGLTIQSGTFTWSGGHINYTTAGSLVLGQLTISQGAEMDWT